MADVPEQPTPEENRFWRHVNKAHNEGCWLWTGAAHSRDGRGQSTFGGRRTTAPRVSWQLSRGSIPEGMWVLHNCDNAACVNPDHLYLGTHTDNMRDMRERGRFFFARDQERCESNMRGHGKAALGIRNAKATLTFEQVREIRASQLTQDELAIVYGVAQSTIGRIKRGEVRRTA